MELHTERGNCSQTGGNNVFPTYLLRYTTGDCSIQEMVTFLMKRENRKNTQTRSNAFGHRLNAFALFPILPFHQEGHKVYTIMKQVRTSINTRYLRLHIVSLGVDS